MGFYVDYEALLDMQEVGTFLIFKQARSFSGGTYRKVDDGGWTYVRLGSKGTSWGSSSFQATMEDMTWVLS